MSEDIEGRSLSELSTGDPPDFLLWFAGIVFGAPAVIGLLYVGYLFISVLFGGGLS